MKWVVRTGAGVAIAFILLSVIVWDHNFGRFGGLIALILIAVGMYEGIDMSSWWGDNDDDDQQGPFRPA